MRIRPDTTGFEASANSGLVGPFKRIAAGMGGILAGVGVAAFAKSTLDIGRVYQDTLNNLRAVSGATEDQMAKVSATAKDLGNDLDLTNTSASDAAIAMTELAKGGLSVDAAMQAAKGTLQLASAAGITAGQAAEIQSAALNAFSLEADQAGRVSDVLANAANAAAGEITDFAQGLSQASAVAAATGISIEDTAATLGILANNGIKGSDAGTLLKSALLALQSPSKPAIAAMKQLGVSAYDAEGNFVGLSEIFGQLQSAQQSMTPAAYAAATSTLFGSDAARLAGIAGKEGAAGFDLMREAMGKQGSAAEVAAAKAKGVTGAIEAFKSQIEGIQIEIFERIAPVVETVVRAVAAALPVIGDAVFVAFDAVGSVIGRVVDGLGAIYTLVTTGNFTEAVGNALNINKDSFIVDFLMQVRDLFVTLTDFVKNNTTPIMAGLGAALAVLLTPLVFSAVSAIWGLVTVIGGALLSGLSLLLSPIVLVAAAIGGLVAIFVAAYEGSKPLRDAISNLRASFQVFLDVFNSTEGEGISGFFDKLTAGIEAALPMVKASLAQMGMALWEWIEDNIGPALAQLWSWLEAVGAWAVNTALPWLRAKMIELGTALVEWIGPRIGPALAQLGEWLAALGSWLIDTALPWVGAKLAELGKALVDWIGPRIGPMLVAIGEFLGKLLSWIIDVGLPLLGEKLLELGKAIVDWIRPRIPGMLASIGEFIGTLLGWLVGTGLPLLVGGLLKLAYELVAWILPRIPDLLINIGKFLASLVGWLITDGIPMLYNAFSSLASGAIKGFWEAIQSSPLFQKIKEIWNGLIEIAGQVWTSVKNTFLTGINNVIGLINNFLGAINTIASKVGIDLNLHINPIGYNPGNSPISAGNPGGRGVRLAAGGTVPGWSPNDKADNIPAMLTANEYVQPVSAVRHYGTDFMNAIRNKSIPKEALYLAEGGLVAFGRKLQSMGARVAEHPAFGGVAMNGHGRTSLHYTGNAIDVNTRGGTSPQEQAELAPMAALARAAGFRTIFMSPGHYNHLHVDTGRGASIGSAGGGGSTGGGFIREALGAVAQGIADPIKASVTRLTGGNDFMRLAGGAANTGIQALVDSIRQRDEAALAAENAASGTELGLGGTGTGDQLSNARIIGSVARSMGFGRQGMIVALATALQESGLKNINYGDRDSVGLFQQRPSQGWGSVAQIMNPSYSARKFFEALRGVRGWESLPVTVAAQRVQRSAFPNAYAKHTPLANSLATQVGFANGGLVKQFDTGGILRDGMIGVNQSSKPERVLNPDQTRAFEKWMANGHPEEAAPLVGNLTIQVGADANVRDGMEEAMFHLRRLRRGSR